MSPVGTQNITFRLYRDTGAGCTPANLVASVPGFTNPHTKAVTLNGAGTGSVTSDAFTPTAVGTYRWVATYEGDANNASVTGVCTDVTERTIVSQATPSILTDASNDQQLGGGALTDIATVSGVVSPVGTQNITFRLYRDTGAGCTPANLVASVPGFTNPHTKAVTLNGAGTGSVTSDAFTPTAVGTYRWVATYEGDVNNASVTGVCTDVTERTIVAAASPTIRTQASDESFVFGAGTLGDVATVSGLSNPIAAQDSVRFELYKGADCAVANRIDIRTDSTPTFSAGGTSASFDSGAGIVPPGPGTYRWRAFFSGDDNNDAVSGLCNADHENQVVAPATPTIETTAAADFVIGAGQLTDNATVSGIVNPIAAQDSVEFRLYKGADCADANLVTTRTDASLTYNGTQTSGAADSGAPIDPTGPGTYRWRAFYSGDDNNAAVSGPCNASGENTVVTLAAPSIATQATGNFVLGSGQLSDNATVTGLVRPIAAEDSVEFRLYRGADCSAGNLIATRTDSTLTYDASATTATADSGAPIDPPGAGTYRWRAFYSGDTNNAAVSGPCNADNENTVVARVTPTIATTASPGITVGEGVLTDVAIVSGRFMPVDGATIVFRLYGPDDALCTGTAVYTSPEVPYPAAGGPVTSPPFTPVLPGVYRWTATYSGDANNTSVAGACNDADEVATVSGPPPPPPPPIVAPPPPPPPPQEVLPAPTTPKGTAAVSGKTGCQGTPFNVVVGGRQIERVIYSIDGKVVKVLTKPNSGIRFKLPIVPKRFRTGTHRVLARVVFTADSKTKNRTLRVVFSRCAKKAASPAFTG